MVFQKLSYFVTSGKIEFSLWKYTYELIIILKNYSFLSQIFLEHIIFWTITFNVWIFILCYATFSNNIIEQFLFYRRLIFLVISKIRRSFFVHTISCSHVHVPFSCFYFSIRWWRLNPLSFKRCLYLCNKLVCCYIATTRMTFGRLIFSMTARIGRPLFS